MKGPLELFATTPKGMAELLAEELRALGASAITPTHAGVSFAGDLETAYRACLWSRLASRVLLPLARFPAATPETLYAGVRHIAWGDHLTPSDTLAVDFASSRSRITHTHFGALKVKDAIVDQFREACGVRPSVATHQPNLRINVYVSRDQATVSLDLCGESLHRRGYRSAAGEAPMKENLAAAILWRAGWLAIARHGGPLLDPMCGSGTLPIEAALMAADIAPGLLRSYFGFLGWRGHDAPLWEELLAEASARRARGVERLPPIVGFDADPHAVRAAIANVERAGLRGLVHIERRELAQCAPPRPADSSPGLVVVNPPYGERIGETQQLTALYASLGEKLRTELPGWRAAVLTGNPELGKNMGLRACRIHQLYNGAIPCRLLHFEISEEWLVTRAPAPRAAVHHPVAPHGAGAAMFANRLRKNLKELGRWAQSEGISCYRLYDADMPEYALAIDLYKGAALWAHVQEYQAPATVEAQRARDRLEEALAVVPEMLAIAPDQVFFKVRSRQRGRSQYQKRADQGQFHEVQEASCTFLVNFTDYLDTGLFLDHRPTRALIRELARGQRFLNLFGYTGTATVSAAAGGAAATTTVDLSATYLAWARRNLARNGYADRYHQLIRADCLQWLAQQGEAARQRRYGLIFVDPPTFSTSQRMAQTFDVQRDHAHLIQSAVRLLAPGGVLIFSTNRRKFHLDQAALAGLRTQDITPATIPRDFARNPRIHTCWRIQRR